MFSDTTGKIARVLFHSPWPDIDPTESTQPPALHGYTRAANGDVYFALGRGPFYQDGIENGNPRPGSCGGSVYEITASTGRTRLVFSVDRNHTVAEPTPNPTETAVAYRGQSCTATFAEAAMVHNLSSGRETRTWVNGGGATHLSWSGNGSKLLYSFTYQSGTPTSPPAGYVIVAATAHGAQPPAAVRQLPNPHCQIHLAMFDPAGIAVSTLGCPSKGPRPVTLLQLDATGRHVLWGAYTGIYQGLMSLATTGPHHQLLIAGGTTKTAPFVDEVQLWNGRSHTILGRYRRPNQQVDGAE